MNIHCDAPTRNGHDFMTPGEESQHCAQMYTGNRHQSSACTTMVYNFISSSGTRSTKPHKFNDWFRADQFWFRADQNRQKIIKAKCIQNEHSL